MPALSLKSFRNATALALTLAVLSGCAVHPKPITDSEQSRRALDDYSEISANYVPVTGPLSLSDAIARALKYNYDAAVTKSEISLQDQQSDLTLYQLLPKIAADAGYTWRDNYNAAESVDVFTNQRSLVYSYSEPRNHGTYDLQLSWNILDAGVSYFQARQQGYRAYAAVERRRRVIEGIVKSVQEAYWKASSANHMLPMFDPLIERAQNALDASRRATEYNLQPPLQALDYQQNLLQVISQLRRMQSDLYTAKIQLAALINVPDPDKMQLVEADPFVTMPSYRLTDADIKKLEEASLYMRPELREAAYEERIDKQDVYKEMVKMMPGAGVLAGLDYDNNRFLYNKSWRQIGVNASWNLMNVISAPQAIKAAKTSVANSRQRRLALSVAVLTQVNVGYQEYLAAMEDYKNAEEINGISQKILAASANAQQAETQSNAESVRRELGAMVAQLQRNQAIAHAHTALVNLYSAVGEDLVPPNADLKDLQTLSGNVRVAIAGWEQGRLPSADVPPPAAKAK